MLVHVGVGLHGHSKLINLIQYLRHSLPITNVVKTCNHNYFQSFRFYQVEHHESPGEVSDPPTHNGLYLHVDVWLEAGVGPDIEQGAGGQDNLSGGGSLHTLLRFTHEATDQVLPLGSLRANMLMI